MKKLHFTYGMQIAYSIEVLRCNFTIKCIPKDTARQSVENIHIQLSPATSYQSGQDGFCNKQIYGVNELPHKMFQFQIEGDALTGLAEYEEEENTDLSMVFRHPHGLNVPGESIKRFFADAAKSIGDCKYDTAFKLMHKLYATYEYRPCTTNVDTTAEEAFTQGYGVCQDYAHILISLLHMAGIAARYVTGFIIGEGQSHAWVEFLCKGKWYGIDPTHDRPVSDDYIKIGHGRDAKDCMINRGIMHGGGLHTQSVQVSVQEEQ